MGQRLIMPNADFSVLGIDNNKKLTQLEVITPPDCMAYPLGSSISLQGAVFHATYDDGTVSSLRAEQCRYWPAILEQDNQKITIAYTYDGITAFTSLNYTVEG